MEKNIIRSLIVLAAGVAMALAAYAGQTGYGDDHPFEDAYRALPIHTSWIDGHRFDYRLVYPPESGVPIDGQSPESAQDGPVDPELMLYITDPEGDQIYAAAVKYTVTGPRGTQVKARALPAQGGYSAGIYCRNRGTYQVRAEVTAPGANLVDNFAYEIM